MGWKQLRLQPPQILLKMLFLEYGQKPEPESLYRIPIVPDSIWSPDISRGMDIELLGSLALPVCIFHSDNLAWAFPGEA